MNYRHIYHAGNFADIFKHIILTLCLEKFIEKDAPFFALDTHAGIAKYDLLDERSVKTGEALGAIRKILLEKDFQKILPQNYLKTLAKLNCCKISELPDKIRFYAGSPLIIKDFLRQQDRAIFSELNNEDFLQLKKSFAGNKKITFLKQDGFELLKSKLPPLEKRGLIIIDPAFEKDQSKISADYDKIISSLKEAQKRFAHGVYLVWYPIIKTDKVLLEGFYHKISELKFEKKMHAIFDIGDGEDLKMHACGMFIFNAPWQLDEKLGNILPAVLEKLKRSKDYKFIIASL